MELLLKRKVSVNAATLGQLFVNGIFECFTLEDQVRGGADPATVAKWKVQHETAIPSGRYPVSYGWSPHFKKNLPHVECVPGYAGILIHGGNTSKDTDGCILVGQRVTVDSIVGGTSQPALAALIAKITAALNAGEKVWITVQ